MTGAGTDHTKIALSGGPAVILVRPQLAVNIGMCARAMANFGLSDLRLVAPRDGWPRTDEHAETAHAAAAGASHLLDSARLYPDVPSAIADLNFVWATTARERGQQKRICVPAEAMPESSAAIAAGERHGILFGPERTGMDNDEIGAADAIMTFPVNPAYGSLNLAQAVLLVGYEWLRAAEGDAGRFAARERSPPASRAMVQSFFAFLEHELEWRGFFRPASKMPVMKRNLRNIFHRIGLTEQDVNTLRGLMVRLIEGPRGPARGEMERPGTSSSAQRGRGTAEGGGGGGRRPDAGCDGEPF